MEADTQRGTIAGTGTSGAEPGVALTPEAAVALDQIEERSDLALEAGVRPGQLALAAKRGFDVVFALAGIILLFPLWLAIAVMIKLDSPGPILFRQRRVGRDGREFGMFKFRTMVLDADRRKFQVLHMNEAADGLFKIRLDPRMTRFGRFLRSTSLDELPQLLNVLTGTMSVVGPRPLVPEEDAAITGHYRERLIVRPGMTGPWQVAGASRIPISEMVELDLTYVNGWSLLGDLRLIVGTFPHVLLRRGI